MSSKQQHRPSDADSGIRNALLSVILDQALWRSACTAAVQVLHGIRMLRMRDRLTTACATTGTSPALHPMQHDPHLKILCMLGQLLVEGSSGFSRCCCRSSGGCTNAASCVACAHTARDHLQLSNVSSLTVCPILYLQGHNGVIVMQLAHSC